MHLELTGREMKRANLKQDIKDGKLSEVYKKIKKR
jgi:hypothetical protein